MYFRTHILTLTYALVTQKDFITLSRQIISKMLPPPGLRNILSPPVSPFLLLCVLWVYPYVTLG